MESRFCRSVALSQCGSPRSFFFSKRRCGARMIQPVVPFQCSTSSAASFSGRLGSPALPKTDSTKSTFATMDPGANKRTSMRFSEVKPTTSGQTNGRSITLTQPRCGVESLLVNGRTRFSSGGHKAASRSLLKATGGTTFFVFCDRVTNLCDMEDAHSGALVVNRVVDHSIDAAKRLQQLVFVLIASQWQRHSARHAVLVQAVGRWEGHWLRVPHLA
mmetsp:Transcript_20087/g.43832  ORF Transcript_20087/g.43832 Transcript_20087/m.43832 type:complete len:217 (-) Transcript_20087:252-902(-)